MNKTFLIFCFIIFGYNQTYAIPPPDFIIQITSQLGIWFALCFAVFTTVFGTSYFYLKEFYKKHKIVVISAIILLLVSGGVFYKYLLDEEKKENIVKNLELKNYNINKWLSYKDEELYNKYKKLSFDEKVDILLKIEGSELKKWLFDNKDTSIVGESISNESLDEIMQFNNSEYSLLDARENIEHEMGNIPGSIHHRVADLKAGNEWKKLSKDKTYIVICWSGVRGKQVSEFLLSKGVKAVFLEGGVKSWKEYGGEFNGETELADVFKKSNYKKYIKDLEFSENILDGTKIIDARESTRLKKGDLLEYSDNISIMYNTSSYLEKKFNKYGKGDKIIVICNDYINCFDAQLVGIELERVGAELLGIYFKKGVVR